MSPLVRHSYGCKAELCTQAEFRGLPQWAIAQPKYGSYTQGHATQKLHQQLRSRPVATKIQPAQAGFAGALATVAVTLAVAFFEHAIALT